MGASPHARARHVAGVRYLDSGEIELETKDAAPRLHQPMLCYCGGGSRSGVVAESLQKMSYCNVRSIAGGYRASREAGLPTAAQGAHSHDPDLGAPRRDGRGCERDRG